MAEAYISEIRIFGFGYVPKDWASCDGQTLPVAQNTAVFSLLGTTFGGNGQSTFALPDLRGRTPVHRKDGSYALGQIGGVPTVTLTPAHLLGEHTHGFYGSTQDGATRNAQGNLLGGAANSYVTGNPTISNPITLAPAALSPVGGTPHENYQAYAALSIGICMTGIFPSRN